MLAHLRDTFDLIHADNATEIDVELTAGIWIKSTSTIAFEHAYDIERNDEDYPFGVHVDLYKFIVAHGWFRDFKIIEHDDHKTIELFIFPDFDFGLKIAINVVPSVSPPNLVTL